MLMNPTIATLKGLKLHGMLQALEEQQQTPAIHALACCCASHSSSIQSDAFTIAAYHNEVVIPATSATTMACVK